MKKILCFICAIFIACIANADTIDINWHVGDSIYDTSTCTVGGDVILPTTPTKRGYTFKGWKLKYTPIEYIELTGTQWIDTQIIFTSSIGYELVYKPTAIDTFVSTVNGKGQVIAQGNGYWEFRTLSSTTVSTGVRIDTSKFVTLKYNINSTCSVDDIAVSIAGHNMNYNASIFVPGTRFSGRGPIKYLKIYDNDTLVRHLIPVLDENGVACMFDKVSGQFFYNSGTGDFIAGPAL